MLMLGKLFPQTQIRYESLPVLGAIWEDLCDWLGKRGYPPDAIRRRVQAGPLLEDRLQERGIRSLSGLSEQKLLSLALPPTRWTEQLACSLVHSLIGYLQARDELQSAPATPIGRQVAAYRRYLENVRGLS